MSVVINTNAAATMAADNLAQSSALLQKSLNRLSSGSRIVSPEDDAGGLAVSMKLSATAHRQAAVSNNIANSTSFLQTQDGVLNVVGKVLTRISELKTLYFDPTKNSTDKANYNAEFKQLQSQLSSLSNEKFNGVDLFGSTGLNVGVTADATSGTTVAVGAAALMGSSGPSLFSDEFNDLSNWSVFGGSPSVSANKLILSGGSDLDTLQSFSGALTVTYDVKMSGANSQVALGFVGGGIGSNLAFGTNIFDTAVHSVKVVFDGSGNASTFLDNSSTAADTQSGVTEGLGLALENFDTNQVEVSHFAVNAGLAVASNTSSLATATDLGSVNLDTITSAIQDVASLRANNGAQQSRLGFAAEVLTTNKANIEAANSRITDVDVAAESTQLARYNVLTQAGTAMLSQANQSTQIALKLLS
jgi:flagellin-like hook-associated protein FlgL